MTKKVMKLELVEDQPEDALAAEGFPMQPQPVEKVALFQKIEGYDEWEKVDEIEVTTPGIDGMAEAAEKLALGLMTKRCLAKHLLRDREIKGRERTNLQKRLDTEYQPKCDQCLTKVGICLRREDEEDYADGDGRYFGLAGAYIDQIRHGNHAYDDAKRAIRIAYEGTI